MYTSGLIRSDRSSSTLQSGNIEYLTGRNIYKEELHVQELLM